MKLTLHSLPALAVITALIGIGAAGEPPAVDAKSEKAASERAPSEKAPIDETIDRSERAKEILASLRAAKTKDQRLELIDDLVGLAPIPVDALRIFLERDRVSTESSRHKLLTGIGAAVPNAKGSFQSPGREKDESLAEDDRFDWAEKLASKPKSPALGDLLGDIAAIRALARADDPRGAQVVLDYGFAPKGIMYRDEVGRYLRRGNPYSVPGLLRALVDERPEVRRYAQYQLERMDREAPHKAIRAAKRDERLQLEIFKAYGETLHREAVYVILASVDHPSPAIREGARAAWMEFVTKQPRHAAPRRRLTLPGGTLTKISQALYLDHRDLADIELRKRLEAMTGTAPAEGAEIEAMTGQLLAAIDERRASTLTTTFDEGRKAAGEKDIAAAAAFFDRVLASAPDFAQRAAMAPTYLAHGKQLLESEKYTEAAIALRKAHAVDPTGPSARSALATAHIARARMIEAAGGDSAAELAKARDVDPDAVDGGGGPQWMLFAGIGGGLAGLFLVLAGAFVRRRQAAPGTAAYPPRQ